MGVKVEGKVEKVNGKEVSYDEFVRKYMEKNKPVILTGLMDNWRACKDWVNPDGTPNLNFFSSNFPNSTVQVADCVTREFSDQKRIQMSVSEFIRHWLHPADEDGDNRSKPLLYLKDWHFVKEYPEYIAYETPMFFCDDWLNMYLDKYHMHDDGPDTRHQHTTEISCSDYRFVYMGAKGTWTPLHADVFRSYSWSANVCGRKQWYFLPPNQSQLVFDRNMKSSVYSIFEDVDVTKFPCFEQAIWLECTQEQNEIIFVPSGWYHQVHNLVDTISINHNWFNGYNLSFVWDLLLRDYNEAKEYIEDIKDLCDDFEGLCQRNLAANTGMNFYDFFIFMVRITCANLVQLHHLAKSNEPTDLISSQRAQNIIFNLKSIQTVALKMKTVGVEAYRGFMIDCRKMLEEATTLELCNLFERTYGMIHQQQKVSYNMKPGDDLTLFDFFKSAGGCVCTPEDLVNFINTTFGTLSLTAIESFS